MSFPCLPWLESKREMRYRSPTWACLLMADCKQGQLEPMSSATDCAQIFSITAYSDNWACNLTRIWLDARILHILRVLEQARWHPSSFSAKFRLQTELLETPLKLQKLDTKSKKSQTTDILIANTLALYNRYYSFAISSQSRVRKFLNFSKRTISVLLSVVIPILQLRNLWCSAPVKTLA